MTAERPTRKSLLLTFMFCWAVMMAYSFVTAPIPGVNETHYIGKSRHFWQPEWCGRDLLMGSLDAHYVFCWTFGVLPSFLDLDTAAVAGRAIGLAMISSSWVSLCYRLTAKSSHACAGLVFFLALHQIENLSGEWLIGGIEGKVPSWSFGLLAIRYFLDRRWLIVGPCIGASAAFHPVVGAWAALAIGVAGLWGFVCKVPFRNELGQLLLAVLLAVIVSLPGVIPAAAALSADGVPPELEGVVRDSEHMQNRANYVQVFGRLQHHLDPMDFGFSSWAWYAALSVFCCVLTLKGGRFAGAERIWWIVVVTGLFSVLSLFLAWGPRPGSEMSGWEWKAKLLKVYPFRLFDVLLPAVVGLQIASVLADKLKLVSTYFIATAFVGGLLFLTAPRGPFVTSPPNRVDWIEACAWVSQHVPEDGLCVTPRESKDFKWLAQRAEFVNHKDIPQDAAGIVEWNQRLWLMQSWRSAALDNGDPYSKQDMFRLRELTEAEFLVTHAIGPIEIEPVFENSTYRIYSLPESP